MDRKRIVIIEDETAICDLLETHFSQSYHITVFNDAETCLGALSTLQSAALFIIDYHLPQMDGSKLCSKLKTHFPEAKYMLVTGYLSPEQAQTESQTHFDRLVLKPFQVQELEGHIRELVG